ncbi:MAG: aminoacetone oxidase family FAD-binding enzyme [Clostridia bacterium]|nr:aminoacetone oxidase family FAD-binding enzyme [Clostridia bacterium]
MNYDLIIIGGGAAGLAASVFLTEKKPHSRVLILEKNPRVGKKLMATGNGTCNLTNVNATAADYHGAPALADKVLKTLTIPQTMDFFTAIGVDCVPREDGKVYPASLQAGAVLDALRLTADARGVTVLCDKKVTALKRTGGGWTVCVGEETYAAPYVLVAVGGAAAPALGGGADGYRLLTDLGCAKTPLFPSIVQVRTDTDYVRSVKGIRVDATLRLCLNGKEINRNTGEVLFTDYGLSGPAVMQVSRPVGDWERQKKGGMTAHLDLLPAWEESALADRIRQRRQLAGRTMEDLLTGLVNKRVGQTILRVAGVLPLTRSADTLTDEEAARVAATLKDWCLNVTGTQGFGGAQVTAGGIDVTEVTDALEIRRLPGVYAVGEVLDVDGDCGGYNLQFAWSSAYVAAMNIAEKL